MEKPDERMIEKMSTTERQEKKQKEDDEIKLKKRAIR